MSVDFEKAFAMAEGDKKTYLITGANRGLGRGIVEIYLARPNTSVIAAVRSPSHPSTASLWSLPRGANSTLYVVKLDSGVPGDAAAAVDQIRHSFGIAQLDVVLANAGMATDYSTVDKVPAAALEEHMRVNAFASVYLFQAVRPLLLAGGKFVNMTSALGSVGAMETRPIPNAAYGPSKAVMNWFSRKIHFENEDIVAFSLDPGFSSTDMGQRGAKALGMTLAGTPVAETVAGCVKQIDAATRESAGGHNIVWDGSEDSPW